MKADTKQEEILKNCQSVIDGVKKGYNLNLMIKNLLAQRKYAEVLFLKKAFNETKKEFSL